jgi:hypothetical protein
LTFGGTRHDVDDNFVPHQDLPMRITPFAALLLCACYVSTPLVTTAPQPGDRLSVQLTDQGTASLAQYLGPGVTGVDGRLLQDRDSALTVSVSAVTLRSGDQQFWKGESVTLPRSLVAQIRERKVSVWRSGLLASAVVAVGAAIGSGIGGGSSSAQNGKGGPSSGK